MACVALAPYELILHRIERFLRFKYREEITDSVRVELIGKVDRLPACLRCYNQSLLAFLLAPPTQPDGRARQLH